MCEEVNISEVTFFKYFEVKDEILQFYMAVWNYKREMIIQKSGRKKGKDAIFDIFESISQTVMSREIMLSLVCYFAKIRERSKSIVLEDWEKWILFPEKPYIIPMSLDEQLILHINESFELDQLNFKVIKKTKDLKKVLNVLLGTIYFGTPLIAKIENYSLFQLYKEQLNIIFI